MSVHTGPSAVHFDVEGPNSYFPLSAGSSGHTSTAQSSTSAETVAVAGAFRSKGDPAITMLALILGRFHTIGDAACGANCIQYRYHVSRPMSYGLQVWRWFWE